MVQAMLCERPAFDVLVQFRVPKSFAREVDRAATSRMMSRADYVRVTLAQALKAEGSDLPGAA
jgi:hypothetical protein